MFAPAVQWLRPAGGVSAKPVPTPCPICDVMPPTLRTRANCPGALQASARSDQTLGFAELHLQWLWRSAVEWAGTPTSQTGCSPELQTRQRRLFPACPIRWGALPHHTPLSHPAESPGRDRAREHACSPNDETAPPRSRPTRD